MKTFKQYLAEAEQINYDMENVTALRKRNKDAAGQILKDNKEIIDDINNAKNLSQFNTEEQRDAVVAVYILSKEDPELAKKMGVDIQNPKFFEQEVKDKIIDPTRQYAKENGKKHPGIKEVKGKDEEPEKEEAPKEEEPKTTVPAAKKEEPGEKGEDEIDSEEDEEDEEDEDKKDTSSSFLDKQEFPAPKMIANQIEKIKQETEKQIKEVTPKNASSGQQATIDNAIKELNKKLNNYIKTADRADRSYSVNPTPMSMRRGSTIAKKALIDAEATAKNLVNKAKRKQLKSRTEVMAQRAGETLKSGVEGVKKVASSRTSKNIGSAVKRGAEQATAATQRVIGNIAQSTTAKMIAQTLGNERAQEYINLLRNKKEAEAEKIRAEALNKRGDEKESGRLDRMEKSIRPNTQRELRRASTQGPNPTSRSATNRFRDAVNNRIDRRRQA